MQDLSREDKQLLGALTTRDEAGTHFLQRYDYDWLTRMEEAGYIIIHRGARGMAYSEDEWWVEVHPIVSTWFDAYGHLREEDS